MYDFDLLNLIQYPAIVVNRETRTIYKMNETFRKLFANELSASIEYTPEFLYPVVERIICNMEDLDAMIMTCPMPINGETKRVRAKCQYADQAAKENIVAVFDMETESTMLPLESHLISQFIPGGMLIIDIKPEGYFVRYANDPFYQMIGYTRDEFRRMNSCNLLELIYEKDRQSGYQEVKRQISRSRQFYIDGRMKCRDGVIKWVNMVGREFKNLDGTKVFYAVVTDISESLRLRE